MAKIKLNIKNTQIAEAINLGKLKSKIAKKKEEDVEKTASKKDAKEEVVTEPTKEKEEGPRIRARSRSAFADGQMGEEAKLSHEEGEPSHAAVEVPEENDDEPESILKSKANFLKKKSEAERNKEPDSHRLAPLEEIAEVAPPQVESPVVEAVIPQHTPEPVEPTPAPIKARSEPIAQQPIQPKAHFFPRDKLGPTGRHVNDLLPKPRVQEPVKPVATPAEKKKAEESKKAADEASDKLKTAGKPKPKAKGFADNIDIDDDKKKGALKPKEFRDVKPVRRTEEQRTFDSRDRQGLRASESEEDRMYRRKRRGKVIVQEDVTIRPTELKVRVPITVKDLASEMKLKSSQLISKMFLQGVVITLNDFLDDETTIQLLGQEFGCNIIIDTSEEQRIRITDKTIREEIQEMDPEKLIIRPPVVAFMGHVDHGKTSLIDYIRKSNRAAGEAGAITQHIGAFRCHTSVGDIAILDTPGHEAFSAMRARGADVTDIVVLVVAGDEGLRQQTQEAIQHARSANVTIVVAINKSDKPNFNADNVYRQLSEVELLPEAWGGQTITVNCSATTGEGIQALLEMLALQAEILELRANPEARARGSVLESEMHKGLGSVATVLVQNGTLKLGDALVFGQHWGRVKTMRNEFGKELLTAGPSTPVEITGLSGLPEAGQDFIVVKSEREAREIAEARLLGLRQTNLQLAKRQTMESLFLQAADTQKKILNVLLRTDMQGSLEALKAALMKIESQKIDLNIIFAGVGEVSESDVQLAAASKAIIIGFHTQIESHADTLVKQTGVQVRLHDIIYHAVDDVKLLMTAMLDKIAQETDKGKALVKATFKASHVGLIAGCQVIEGSIHRNNHIRVTREGAVIWKGAISSLKRVKEDVREVQKGLECGIVFSNFNDIKENDVLEAYEVTYITQEL